MGLAPFEHSTLGLSVTWGGVGGGNNFHGERRESQEQTAVAGPSVCSGLCLGALSTWCLGFGEREREREKEIEREAGDKQTD